MVSIPQVPTDATLRDAAVIYASSQLFVGPMLRGKHAGSMLGNNWPAKTSNDPGVVAGWWDGIGREDWFHRTSDIEGLFIHCGPSGLVVFDVDNWDEMPALLFESIKAAQPCIQITRRNKTRAHFVFALNGNLLGNSRGNLGAGWGDVRGNNGIIVAQPTAHLNLEGIYLWVRTGEVPTIPQPLEAAVLARTQSGRSHEGRVAHGDRDNDMLSYCGLLRARSVPIDRAEILVLNRLADFDNSDGRATPEFALGKLRHVYASYPAGARIEDSEHVVQSAESAVRAGRVEDARIANAWSAMDACATRVRNREHALTTAVLRMAKLARVNAVAEDEVRRRAVAAGAACGLIEQSYTTAIRDGFEQAGNGPPIVWPPAVAGDGDPRPGWEMPNAAAFRDELELRLGNERLTGVFRRGGEIVHCVRVGEDGYIRPPGQLGDGNDYSIVACDPKYLANLISINYFCFEMEGSGDNVRVNQVLPSGQAVSEVLSDINNEAIPRVVGVTHSPLVRPDGTMLDAAGYDTATRLLYLPLGADLGGGQAVRPDDAKSAFKRILDVYRQFPWVAQEDLATYLGFVFTPALRLMVPPPWPWLGVTATGVGSGKSLLAGMLRRMWGGRMYGPPVGEPRDFEKKLTAILHSTTGVVVQFDNLPAGTALANDTLASLMTTPTFSDRILGSSVSADMPNDRVWVLTGNNLTLGGELPRRVAVVGIDAGRPRAWERTGFTYDLMRSWAPTSPEAVTSDVLTVVAGWAAAGAPRAASGRSDDFGDWKAAVGGLLAWSGLEAEVWPAAAIDEDATGGGDTWGLFLEALHWETSRPEWGDGWFTMPQLMRHFNSFDGASMLGGTSSETREVSLTGYQLRKMLPEKYEGIPFEKLATSLGYEFRAKKGMWFGNYSLVRSLAKNRTPDGMAYQWRTRRA